MENLCGRMCPAINIIGHIRDKIKTYLSFYDIIGQIYKKELLILYDLSKDTRFKRR